MRARQLVRGAMVLVMVAVVVALALLWRDRPDDSAVNVPPPPDTDDDVVSVSSDVQYIAERNGVLRYELSAARALEFDDNRNVFEGDVRLLLYGPPVGESGEQDVTAVTADRLELVERSVPVEGDPYESVELLDNVRAVLPDGEEFSSDELTYSEGELSTDSGVRMRKGGLVVESRDLAYDQDTGVATLRRRHPSSARPEIRGPVKVWSEPASAQAAVPELEGSAVTLVYETAGSVLRLQRGGPVVTLPNVARINGAEVTMKLDAGTIDSIEASGGARAQWWRGEGGESADFDSMEAETIAMVLRDGEPQGLTATVQRDDAPRPRLEVADGELRADLLEVAYGDDGATSMSARGDAFFFPSAADNGLQHVRADGLLLGSGGGDELIATGSVEIRMAAEEGAVTFSGPRARLAYREGAIAEAEWPAGLSYRDPQESSEMSAGHGEFDADTGDWILRSAAPGMPPAAGRRPRLRGPEMDVSADQIRLGAGGEVLVTGAVDARLQGDMVRTVGPLFGDAAEVQARADELLVRSGNEGLDFAGNARIFQPQGEQVLSADEINLRPRINELQADGNVFVSLVNEPDPERGREEARSVVLTGQRLLVEGNPMRMVVAGEALLDLQDVGRTIGGGRLEVLLDDNGVWDTLEVYDNVVMTDPAGRGQGAHLEYNADTGLVIIHAAENGEATFIPEQGLDIRDREALRLEWDGDNLRVTAMQNGTTQTLRGGGRGGGQR